MINLFIALESEISKPNADNLRMKNNAKELIERTKKVIDNLDINNTNPKPKKSQNKSNTARNLSNNESDHSKINHSNILIKDANLMNNINSADEENVYYSTGINNKRDEREMEINDILHEDSTCKEPKMKKNNERHELDDEVILKSINNLIFTILINSIFFEYTDHITLNTNAINQRLLEKIKTIKNMEKEQKEKNQTIETLRNKVEKQKEEIVRLNELLLVN